MALWLQKLRRLCNVPTLLINTPPKPMAFLFAPNSYAHLSSSSSSSQKSDVLTKAKRKKINQLIPRLCSSSHLSDAIRLLDAALLANPPPGSLSHSLSSLIDHLSGDADISHSMSFLSRLDRNRSARSCLLPICQSLISAYFRKGKPKDALKVFDWMSSPGSVSAPDSAAYAIMINGFCGNGMILEALKALRAMLSAGLFPEIELGTRVYNALLREARIREAQDLNEAMSSIQDGGESIQKVLILLESMILNWVD